MSKSYVWKHYKQHTTTTVHFEQDVVWKTDVSWVGQKAFLCCLFPPMHKISVHLSILFMKTTVTEMKLPQVFGGFNLYAIRTYIVCGDWEGWWPTDVSFFYFYCIPIYISIQFEGSRSTWFTYMCLLFLSFLAKPRCERLETTVLELFLFF